MIFFQPLPLNIVFHLTNTRLKMTFHLTNTRLKMTLWRLLVKLNLIIL